MEFCDLMINKYSKVLYERVFTRVHVIFISHNVYTLTFEFLSMVDVFDTLGLFGVKEHYIK